MGWSEYNAKKIKAQEIYEKMRVFLTSEDLEYFDVCKDQISKMIFEDEKRMNKIELLTSFKKGVPRGCD